jgi:hypothetical protein
MSTYSPSLRIELITTGDQAGTWGNTTNTNLGGLIESAIAGYVSVSVTTANQAFTALNGAADEARQQTIALTTTTGANFAVYAPPAEKTYVIYNASAYTATIYNSTVIGNTTAAGAGVAIPAGKTMTVWTEGTNFAFQNTHIIGTVVGNVTGNLTGNVTGNVTGNLTGNVTGNADTATTATNANNINISATSSVDTTTSLVLVGAQATGNQLPFIDGGLAYNANTNTLNVDNVALGVGTLSTTNWTVTESAGKLVFSYGGVAKFSIDSSGNTIASSNVTAYGTP